MRDDFIYDILPEVREAFARSLYERISAPRSPTLPFRSYRRLIPISRARLATVLALLAGIVVLVAWSQAVLGIRYVSIGELLLVEISKLGGLAQAGHPPPAIPTPGQLPTGVGWATGMEEWEFSFLSPEWIPGGFSPVPLPAQMIAYEETIGMWADDASETIRLFAVPKAGGMHPYAPPETFEQLTVKGTPAILIRGHYRTTSTEDPHGSRPWDETLGLQLYWAEGNSVYALETFGSYVTPADLVRMADSMQISPSLPSQ